MKWLLLLVAFPALACDTHFESVVREKAGWRISARPTASERPITVCEKTLYDLKAGERIHIEGWAQIDAMGPLIGVNLQIAYCDDAEPECNFTGRWEQPSVHRWATGNIWRTNGQHHRDYSPIANYVSQTDQAAVKFKLFTNIYSSQPDGAYAGIDDCAITFERHGP